MGQGAARDSGSLAAGANTEDFSVELSADIPPTAENVEDMDVHSLNFQKVGLQNPSLRILRIFYKVWFVGKMHLKPSLKASKMENMM